MAPQQGKRSPFMEEIEAKWQQRRAQARATRRVIVAVLGVLLVGGGLVGGLLLTRFGEAAGVSRCRGSLRQLSRGLMVYASDHGGRYPPYGSDADLLLGQYIGGANRSCPLNQAGPMPSYTIAPGLAGRTSSARRGPEREIIALVETEFRHEMDGVPMMAVAYLDGWGGSATPDELALPPWPGGEPSRSGTPPAGER